MFGNYEYKNLENTLAALKIQILDSLKYAAENLPQVDSPADLWDVLKPLCNYTSDGDGEIIMTMQTFLDANKNLHRRAGAGDCDDFVVMVCACCLVSKIPVKIVLAGRTKIAPVHIYCKVFDGKKWQPFDLTEAYYMSERNYPIKQTLKV
jgi:hypothetical protein